MGDQSMMPGQRLPVARYHLLFRATDDLHLPEYAGSLLRGQFGAALKRTVCITELKQCAACPLLRTCAYPAMFETPAPPHHRLQKFSSVPNPYVIEPPPFGARRIAQGDTISFGVVLFGRALNQLPLVVHSFRRAFRQGLGKRRARAELLDVLLETSGPGTSVWDTHTQSIRSHLAELVVPAFPEVDSATLRINTPLRLQNQGRALGPEELRARTLITAIMRRASLMFDIHADMPGFVKKPAGLALQAEALQDTRNLRWRDWRRYSSRQKQEMALGGVMGEWTLTGPLAELACWLWLGQWLHAGKNATMGLGKYEVTFTHATPNPFDVRTAL